MTPGSRPRRERRDRISGLRAALIGWYDSQRRDLPWRRTRDPYAIWVSEVMLQQTRVATVIPYYHRFLERFPDPVSLAGADEEDVLGVWSGLGYYRRARALHRGARELVLHHAGRLPADPEALRRLPGVGRYTAGAVASMAFGLPEPVVDGNVRRVLSRLFAVDGREIGRTEEERRLWDVAADLVQGPRPGVWNQALMELGALVCTPREPGCEGCPVARRCRAGRLGEPERFPAPRARRASEALRVAVAVIERGERVLLERRGDETPFRGVWDLPARVIDDDADLERASVAMAAGLGIDLHPGRLAGRARHGIMHRRLEIEIWEARVRRGRIAGRDGLRWADRSRLDTIAISGATRKVLNRIRPTVRKAPRERDRRVPGRARSAR